LGPKKGWALLIKGGGGIIPKGFLEVSITQKEGLIRKELNLKFKGLNFGLGVTIFGLHGIHSSIRKGIS